MRASAECAFPGLPDVCVVAASDAELALLRALADVLAPGGEIVLETYGSRLPADAPAIEVHEPGDVYARDDFV
jgi:hypothetical protein